MPGKAGGGVEVRVVPAALVGGGLVVVIGHAEAADDIQNRGASADGTEGVASLHGEHDFILVNLSIRIAVGGVELGFVAAEHLPDGEPQHGAAAHAAGDTHGITAAGVFPRAGEAVNVTKPGGPHVRALCRGCGGDTQMLHGLRRKGMQRAHGGMQGVGDGDTRAVEADDGDFLAVKHGDINGAGGDIQRGFRLMRTLLVGERHLCAAQQLAQLGIRQFRRVDEVDVLCLPGGGHAAHVHIERQAAALCHADGGGGGELQAVGGALHGIIRHAEAPGVRPGKVD